MGKSYKWSASGQCTRSCVIRMFINDLPDVVSSVCSMYADDTKVYESAINHEKLQEDLDNLVNWADHWQMKFNAGKCSVLQFNILAESTTIMNTA